MKNITVHFLEKCLQKLSLLTLSILTRERSSTRFPAVTRLTVYRRHQLLSKHLGTPVAFRV
eukprot:3649217-Pyramimonas_sp.AAC.1